MPPSPAFAGEGLFDQLNPVSRSREKEKGPSPHPLPPTGEGEKGQPSTTSKPAGLGQRGATIAIARNSVPISSSEVRRWWALPISS